MDAKFSGFFAHQLNESNRVSLPKPFRTLLEANWGGKLKLVGRDDHIEVYPFEAYKKQQHLDAEIPTDNLKVFKELVRRHYNTFDVEYDGQGRILIPNKLKSDYGIDREVYFIGFLDRILIFAPEKWEAFLQDAQEHREENSEAVEKWRKNLAGGDDKGRTVP